ncbi:MAG: hypothetical protein LUF32_03895 [Clostridiales bacterium]|nr:hypothetical protein [Clostridiales bacterium]
MNLLHSGILFLWDLSRSFFGTVFVACVLMSFVLFLAELVIYHAKKTN